MKIKATIILLALFAVALSTLALRAQDASQEYKDIINDIMSKRRTDQPQVVIDNAEKSLLKFLKKYPGTPEAAKAHLMLAQVYSSIGRHDDAIRHVGVFLSSDVEKDQKDRLTARFVLANTYVEQEKFDEAEQKFKEALALNRGEDMRTEGYIKNQIARLDALKRLVIGAPAIIFSAKTMSGKNINLGEYRGKVVLLDFWASWCAPCKKEMPNVKKVYKEFRDKGFEIIGISLDNNEAMFKNYVRQQSITWPQVFDGKGWMSEIGRLYAVSAIPATFLLDRDGRIRHKNLRGSELREAIEALLTEGQKTSSE